MFEVGFSEILMVGLVALLVIGPEQLPKAARVFGFWLGKARNTIANVKAEIAQEFLAEEMRQLARQHQLTDELQQTIQDSEAVVQDINAAMEAITDTKTLQQDDKPA